MVITTKKWADDKIRMNLDTRPMKTAIKVSYFYIPTPQELRHEFRGLGMPSKKKKSKLWDIGPKGGRGSKQNPKC